MRGRKPLAPEVKEANGSYKAHAGRRNESAPTADLTAPDPPDYFDADELEKWGELSGDLTRMGVISSDTREMMVAYCTAYGGWIKARRIVAERGMAETNDKGAVIRSPYSVELHKYRDQMNRLLPEFGLTPASRGKLVSMKEPDADVEAFGNWMERYQGVN